MTATVVSLASHRRRAQAAATCRACRPEQGFVCYPHQLAALADRVRATRDDLDGLLVEREVVEQVAADVLAVIARVTADYLPDERTAR